MRTVFVAGGVDDFRIGNGRRVEAGLVRTGIEQSAHVFNGAHATADGQWNEHLAGHRLDDGQDQVTPIAGGGDVQESQLVRALRVVARRDFHRVASITQFDKIDTFDDTAARDVQAGDDAFGKHGNSRERWKKADEFSTGQNHTTPGLGGSHSPLKSPCLVSPARHRCQ
ncbi:hypothetical protein D3C72_965540 [compost metagenome]